MGHIVDGKNILANNRPQPGRPVSQPVTERIIVEKEPQVIKEKVIVEKESGVDVDQLVMAVVDAIGDKISKSNMQTVDTGKKQGYDDYDDSKTMEQLAKNMTVQRGNSSSNFEDLGQVSETEIDQEEVDKKIDLLKGLGD